MIEQNYESRMSEASYRILADTDLLSAAEKRKSNARFLIDALHNLGIEPMLPLTDDCVPLFVPIEIERRDEIRRALRENGIFCPVHWPLRKDMLS